MSDNTPDPSSTPAAAAPVPAAVPPAAPSAALPAPAATRLAWALGGAGLLLAVAAAVLAWNTQQRLHQVEQELVRRQQGSQDQATEARLLARQASDGVRDAAAKLGVLEDRVAETALQRSQVEGLIQSLNRSRDENVLADLEAGLRVAMQQAALTGSAEPVITVLKQADERLARYNQPRLERVRRAVARDLDRTRTAAAVDIPSLTIRLDEAVRLVDELPLLSTPSRVRAAAASDPAPRAAAAGPATPATPAASAASAPAGSLDEAARVWRWLRTESWAELRSLVRVTEIARPEAMLISPEQGFFLRENLKLRLLNARLALLSRQFDLAQADLRDAQAALERYFDPSARRVGAAADLLRQVQQQARQVSFPRPDETLSTLAAAAAGR